MNLEDINKSMPFIEKEGYVTSIVTQATENAIRAPHGHRWQKQLTRIAASIVIVVSVGCSGWMYMKHLKAQSAPLDTFLSSITDEEAAMLDYYYIEDIYIEEF